MNKYRYLNDKTKFLEYSYSALEDQFSSKEEFNDFFESINSDEMKDLFLKTASFYLFLAKKGDWVFQLISGGKLKEYIFE